MAASRVGAWFNNWHPVTLPLLLLILKIAIALKLGTPYRFVQFPSDISYYGFSFYVWALTAKSSGIDVCPRGMGIGEWNFVIFFLILNFGLHFLAFPTATNVSLWRLSSSTFLALMSGLGSPVFLRWR